MRPSPPFELPPEKEAVRSKAVRLERLTIVYLISAVFFIYLTLGSSQAMKAVWLEDLLSLVPPIAFLVGDRYRRKHPNSEFPYGYHAAIGIAYFAAAMSLAALGIFIFYDSLMKLISFEHPPIGLVQPFGDPVWLGWFMIPALLWSAIPAVFLGRAKIPLARLLHDKVLYADAEMNKADWMTAIAGMAGVVGIGFGIWWADSAAAIFISLDIIKDGFKNVKAAVSDLMDRRPKTVDDSAIEPIIERVRNELGSLDWVDEAQVRLWTAGHVYFGDAQVVPSDERGLVDKIDRATEAVLDLDWRLHEIAIVPVKELGELEDDAAEELKGSGARPDA